MRRLLAIALVFVASVVLPMSASADTFGAYFSPADYDNVGGIFHTGYYHQFAVGTGNYVSLAGNTAYTTSAVIGARADGNGLDLVGGAVGSSAPYIRNGRGYTSVAEDYSGLRFAGTPGRVYAVRSDGAVERSYSTANGWAMQTINTNQYLAVSSSTDSYTSFLASRADGGIDWFDGRGAYWTCSRLLNTSTVYVDLCEDWCNAGTVFGLQANGQIDWIHYAGGWIATQVAPAGSGYVAIGGNSNINVWGAPIGGVYGVCADGTVDWIHNSAWQTYSGTWSATKVLTGTQYKTIATDGQLYGAVYGANATQTVVEVNQTTGNWNGPIYNTIGRGISQADNGDVVSITDSATYYECITIDKNNLTVRGAEGWLPLISGLYNQGATPITVTASGVSLDNLEVIADGAQYGVLNYGSGTAITNCSFDTQHTPIYSNTIAICEWSPGPTEVYNCNFLSNFSVANCGIMVRGTTNTTICYCDFWGCGSSAGIIALESGSSSTLAIWQNTFGNVTATAAAGINRYIQPAVSITESDNTFYNVNYPVSSLVNSGQINGTSWSGSGNCTPQDASVAYDSTCMNDLLTSQGVTLASDSTLQSYTGPSGTTVGTWLSAQTATNSYPWLRYSWDTTMSTTFGQEMRDYMVSIGARSVDRFEVSWMAGYNPNYFMNLKDCTQEMHNALPNAVLVGQVMEAVQKGAIETTPIPNWLWCFNARKTRAVSMRPLEAKWVGSQRRIAHFFDYDYMLGWGVNHWGTDISVPNINKHEGFLYYTHLITEYAKAGLNGLVFAQPQLTFGQNQQDFVTGGANLQKLSKYAKNFGLTYGYPILEKRFTLVGAAASIYWLKNYCQYVDYIELPTSADGYGFGRTWNSLNDAYSKIPPQSATIAGKPTTLEFDNDGLTNDAISTYAHATPADRNTWLPLFKTAVNNAGYYLQYPGVKPITNAGSQNLTGAQYTPPNYAPFTQFFLPFGVYGGNEAIVAWLIAQ